VHGKGKLSIRPSERLRQEIARRLALVRQPQPPGVSVPHWSLLLGELTRRGKSLGRRERFGQSALRARPVMLLPGFATHPNRMRKLGRVLSEAGHRVHQWGLGFNLGPTPDNFAFLQERVSDIAHRHRAPVVLIGWSLGGLFAREIARRQPETVGKVITMGTPFSGDRRANNAWRAYQMVTGLDVDQPPVDCDFATKPMVPTIALWSPRDGVIRPRSAKGWPHERDRAVAMRCTHLGFNSDQRVFAEILRQMDRDD